ncbi:MAG: hypothetical protein KBH99_03170 [Syntrophobacteraceae bacterium]|nr:hypothetical protein [Syntrophobacteraceae bacterium]
MARLEHQIRHDREHVDSHRILAEDIAELGAEEAAEWVRRAAELASQQADLLAKALSALKVH